MRPDSVAGDVRDADAGHAADRGKDATLVFHGLDDSTKHATYRLRQRFMEYVPDGRMADGGLRRYVWALIGCDRHRSVDRLSAKLPSAIRPSAIRPLTPSSSRRHIFDRDDATPDWVAHLANKLHRAPPVGDPRRLLLSMGAPFDSRAWRKASGLCAPRRVSISARRYRSLQPDGKLALRAVTSDGWAPAPGQLHERGWRKHVGRRLHRAHFLGRPRRWRSYMAATRSQPSRFDFTNPLFFGRRTLLTLAIGLFRRPPRRWRFGLPFHETRAVLARDLRRSSAGARAAISRRHAPRRQHAQLPMRVRV